MSKWEEVLWREFEKLDPVDQFTAAGTWTSDITHKLLPELARRRRLAVLDGINDGLDQVAFAEQAGAAPNAVKRLLEEARAIVRREIGPEGDAEGGPVAGPSAHA